MERGPWGLLLLVWSYWRVGRANRRWVRENGPLP